MEKKDLDGIVINCKTEEEARKVLVLADKMGLAWVNKESYLENTHWKDEFSCYDLYDGFMETAAFYIKWNIPIKSAQWFFDNFGDRGTINRIMKKKTLMFIPYEENDRSVLTDLKEKELLKKNSEEKLYEDSDCTFVRDTSTDNLYLIKKEKGKIKIMTITDICE